MSLRYRLPCDNCGRVHPVETGQAGGTIFCECGTKVKIPSMLKIKRLEPWDDAETVEEAKSAAPAPAPKAEEPAAQPVATSESGAASTTTAAPSDEKKSRWSRLSPRRRGLFVVACVVFLVSCFVESTALRPTPPLAVFYKQIDYDLGDGRKIRRDTTPITQGDYDFYFFKDYSDPQEPVYRVDDNLIDRMNSFISYQYFNNVKELDLSDNFYENYEALKTKRLLFLSFFGALALLSIVVALYALLAKESKKQVGAVRGNDWR